MSDQSIPKDLAYYMALPYPIVLIQDEDDGTWFVEIPLLRGCMSVGDDPNDAIQMIRDAQKGWLTVALASGTTIPEPEPEHA